MSAAIAAAAANERRPITTLRNSPLMPPNTHRTFFDAIVSRVSTYAALQRDGQVSTGVAGIVLVRESLSSSSRS
jgi:hypothetical protein